MFRWMINLNQKQKDKIPKTNNKIAVINTGGTISAEQEGKSVKVSENGSETMLSKFDQISNELNLRTENFTVMNKASEEMVPNDWFQIGKSIKNLKNEGFKKVIVTHGTDSLIFSATAMRMIREFKDMKIVFTGSLFPNDHPNSDIVDNLKASLLFQISDIDSGIF
ncbi:MAG: asparaginase domain-containing protein, partial [Flavobacteriales bacterium]